MDPSHPDTLRLKISICEENIVVYETLVRHTENLEANAEECAQQYQVDREDADLELEVAENDQFAATVIIPMLEDIRPLQDVGEELLRALHQGGAAVAENRLTANNPILQDWRNNLDDRVTRVDEQWSISSRC